MIDKMLKRTSCRDYKKSELSKEVIQSFKDIVNSSPTSTNCHHFGCVFVTDNKLKKELSEIIYSTEAIDKCSMIAIFYLEKNMFEYLEEKTNSKLDTNNISFYSTCLFDAAISCTMLNDAAISLGYGTCYQGVVKSFPKEIMKKLNLNNNMPVMGLLIGEPNSINEVKPKLNKVFENEYDFEEVKKRVDEYDEVMKSYYSGKSNKYKFSDFVSSFMKTHNEFLSGDTLKEWTDLIKEKFKI